MADGDEGCTNGDIVLREDSVVQEIISPQLHQDEEACSESGAKYKPHTGVEKYLKLIDLGGLAIVLKGTDDQLVYHEDRLARVEKLLDKFPSEYVSAEEVRESMERVDFLSKKMKNLLDTAERSQKIDQMKITGEITTLSKSIDDLGGRVSNCEAEHNTLSESVNKIQVQLDKKANLDEVRGVRLALDKCAAKDDIASIRFELGNFATKLELELVQDKLNHGMNIEKQSEEINERVAAQFDAMYSTFGTFAPAADLEKVEHRAVEAFNRAKHLKTVVEDISDQVESFSEQVEYLQHSVDEKISREDLRAESMQLNQIIDARIEESRGVFSRLSDQFEAINGMVGGNARNIERFDIEISQIHSALSERITSSDWEQIEAELIETFASKELIAKSMDPIVKKLNQVVAKLIDLDKVVSVKAEHDTVIENREHIQDLFRIIANLSESGAKVTTGHDEGDSRSKGNLPETPATNKDVSIKDASVLHDSGGKITELEQVIKRQEKEISEIKEQLREISIFAHQRQVGTGSFSDTGSSNGLEPKRPDGEKTQRSFKFPVSHDKLSWEKQEKERWMTETRIGSFAGLEKSFSGVREPSSVQPQSEENVARLPRI